jgi:hypothetical protein
MNFFEVYLFALVRRFNVLLKYASSGIRSIGVILSLLLFLLWIQPAAAQLAPFTHLASSTQLSPNAADNNPNIGLPSVAYQSGDLLLVAVIANGNFAIQSFGDGWFNLGPGIQTNDITMFTFYRFYDPQGASFSMTINGTAFWSASISVYRGVDPVAPIRFQTLSTAAPQGPLVQLIPFTDTTLHIGIYGLTRTSGGPNFLITPPTGMNNRLNFINDQGPGQNPQRTALCVSDVLRPSQAQTPQYPASTATNGPLWVTYVLSLQRANIVLPPPNDTIVYSYQSGNWNDPLSWTRDPSGTTQIPQTGILPANNDSVVILNGRSITVTSDVVNSGLGMRLNGGGVLNMAGFRFTNSLRSFTGNGRFRSSRIDPGGITYMPSVTNGNRLIGADGGTIEYYPDTSVMILNTGVKNYFNLELRRQTAGSTNFILSDSVFVYNDFQLTRSNGATPVFTIGNSSSARAMVVNGSFYVNAGCSLRVGEFNTEHRLSIGGDLINNGSIRFLNITSAQYTTAPTTGRAVVTFFGAESRRMDCFGQTDFFRLVVDKGSDQSFSLTINSTATANFRLFGVNNAANSPQGYTTNLQPTINKALVIRNGTLRLTNNISIESLTEGGDDFWLRSTAALWIDGAEVFTSAEDNGTALQSITVAGRLIISAGIFDTRNAEGLRMIGDGVLELRGGTVRSVQLLREGSGQPGLLISGGTLLLDGVGANLNGFSRFDFPASGSALSMSGGTIDVRAPNAGTNGGMLLGVNPLNASISGGTVRLSTTSATNFQFSSSIPFHQLLLTRQTGATGTIQQNSPISVLTDFVLENGQAYACNAQDLTIGRNLIIQAGTAFSSGSNQIVFNGNVRQAFIINGSISGNLHTLVLDNSTDSLVFEGANSNVIFEGDLSINGGVLNDNGKILEFRGNIHNAGRHVGTGKLVLAGNANRTISGNDQGVFTNLDLSGNAEATVYTTTAAFIILGQLNFVPNGNNRRVLNIGIHNLKLEVNANIANFNAFNFIRTNGLQSAGGLTKVFNGNTFTFPVGSSDLWKYTPATFSFDTNPSTYGSMTVRPVNAHHPAVNEPSKSLQYYWRVSSTGFVLGGAKLLKIFQYNQSDVQGVESNYIPAYIDFVDISWNVGSSASVDENTNEITFSGPAYESVLSGEFTAGDNSSPSPFGAVTVYYSRVNNGAWNDVNTWTTSNDHLTISPPATPPSGNSIVRIGNGVINHTIFVTANAALSGNLVIASGSVLDLQTFTGNNFGSIAGETVAGNGKLRINKNGSEIYEFPGGDFGDFLGSNGGEVEFYNTTNNLGVLPNIGQYRNLTLNVLAGGGIQFSLTNTNILDTLTITGNGSGVVQTNNQNQAGGGIVVGKKFRINQGTFELVCPGNIGSREMQFLGDWLIGSGASVITQGSASSTHSIRLRGNLINNGTLSLYDPNNVDRRVHLFMIGEANTAITGSGTLSRVGLLTVDKGASPATTMELNVSGTLEAIGGDWLTLLNGTFYFNKASTLTFHNGNSNFDLVASAAIKIEQGTANFAYGNNNNSDVFLRGKLELVSGVLNIGNSANTSVNNDVIIAGAGNPEFVVNNGTVRINGQIRREVLSQTGALKYIQKGSSTVRIVGRNPEQSRAKLEVLNVGSYFELGGTALLEINAGGGTTSADLFIRPSTAAVTGGTIRLIPADMSSDQIYKVDASVALPNLEVSASTYLATAEITVNSLMIQQDISISPSCSLITNGLNLQVGGKFLKQGTYLGGTSTLTFTGNAAQIEGQFTGADAIHNLTVANGATLTAVNSTSIVINRDLRIGANATLNDNGRNIELKRNCINDGTHNSPANSASQTLIFSGTDIQEIFGTGVFGNLVMENPTSINLKGNITVNNRLHLGGGIFDLSEYKLTLGANAEVTGSFSATRMLRSNGVLGDAGVVKIFASGSAAFTWPIGVFGKYTPATLNFSTNPNGGSVGIKVVNARHPSTRDVADRQLNYYWQVDATGFGGVVVSHTYNYIQSDVTGDEASYNAGRFLAPNWAPTGGIVGALNTSSNVINLNNVNYINGGYTAGEAVEFAAVPTYYSRTAAGNWNTASTWSNDGHNGPAATEPPNGAPVVIDNGHVITVSNANILAESVVLTGNATLDLGSTIGHNFGLFSGTGTIRMRATAGNQFVFPAGNYTSFTSDSGGTVEFYDNQNGTLPTQAVYNKVIFNGTAERIQPDINLIVNGLWSLNAGVVSNANFGRNLEVRKDWINNAGANGYVPGTGTVTFNSPTTQSIQGVTTFQNLIVRGGGNKILSDSVTVLNRLQLDSGIIYLGAHNLYMDSAASTAGIPNAKAMVVQNGTGRILKKIALNQGTFTFPIGEEVGVAEYAPIAVFFTSGLFSNAKLSVQVVNSVPATCGGGANFIDRYWEFQSTGMSDYVVTVTATYNQADVNGNEALIRARMSQTGPCLNGSFADVNLNRLIITTTQLNVFSGGESSLAAPTISAQNLVFLSASESTLTIRFNKGDGQGRLVILRALDAVNAAPQDAETYDFDLDIQGNPFDLGNGNLVVYEGLDTGLTISGLSAATIYHLAIFEFNNGGIERLYRFTSPLVGTRTTTATEPTQAASGIDFNVIGVSSLTLNWNNGNGSRRIVVVKEGSAVDATPEDGIAYAANNNFGQGAALGVGNFVVFDGAGNAVTVANLDQNKRYYFNIVEYNGEGIAANYFVSQTAQANQHTWLRLQLNAKLEGPYHLASSKMLTNLSGVIPRIHPYAAAPWNFTAYDSIQSLPSESLVDWVLLEVRMSNTAAAATGTTVRARVLAFIDENGQLIDTSGNTNGVVMPTDSNGQFYIALYHRTHIPVMSALAATPPVDQVNGAFSYDFTTAVNRAFGTDALVELSSGVWGLYAGRVENTTPFTVDQADRNATWSDRNKLGYEASDAALEGTVDATDRSLTWNNRQKASQIPQ